jgi:hypothetical protein
MFGPRKIWQPCLNEAKNAKAYRNGLTPTSQPMYKTCYVIVAATVRANCKKCKNVGLEGINPIYS